MVISRRRCEPRAHRRHLRPVRGPGAAALGLLRVPGQPGRGGPCLAGAVPPPSGESLPTRSPPVTPLARVWRGSAPSPPPQNAPPRSRLHPPRGRSGRRGPQTFVLFYRDVSSRRAPCARERPPPGNLPPPQNPGTPAAAPSQPSPPSPPHGAGAVVVGNKSSLSVVPWGRGRRLVLLLGVAVTQ